MTRRLHTSTGGDFFACHAPPTGPAGPFTPQTTLHPSRYGAARISPDSRRVTLQTLPDGINEAQFSSCQKLNALASHKARANGFDNDFRSINGVPLSTNGRNCLMVARRETTDTNPDFR